MDMVRKFIVTDRMKFRARMELEREKWLLHLKGLMCWIHVLRVVQRSLRRWEHG